MITLIIGANSSGKSAWAEQLAARLRQGRLIYIATMIPYGEEGKQRVARHRAERRQAGFITFELPTRLNEAQLLPTDTVLLEDVSNLTGNMLFGGEDAIYPTVVLAEITALAERCAHLLAVSIGGLAPSDIYDESTNHFIEVLQQVNENLFSLADTVYEMIDGHPLLRKGRQP